LLAQKGLYYDCIEVDQLDREEREKAVQEVKRLTGKDSFPVFVIHDRVIVGYKSEEIEEALADEG
jgi:glutaredoxin-like protein NrdH